MDSQESILPSCPLEAPCPDSSATPWTPCSAAPRSDPHPTLEEQRSGFAAALTRPAPEDVATRRTVLGGRPALELEPAGAAGRGRLLYLHGGGYVIGSPDTHAGLVGELARRTGGAGDVAGLPAGARAPVPRGRRGRARRLPRAAGDGTDPRELVVAGDSAGGGLRIAAAARGPGGRAAAAGRRRPSCRRGWI